MGYSTMRENNVYSLNPQKTDLVISNKIFRVVSLISKKTGFMTFRNEAVLFNNETTVRVGWNDSRDRKEVLNNLASPIPNPSHKMDGGVLEISALSHFFKPNRFLNIFETIPFEWVKDRDLIRRAVGLFSQLPKEYRYLFNCIFWNAERFKYLTIQPGSMVGHHSEKNGNFKHMVEVAENVLMLLEKSEHANFGLTLFLAFVHDAGKAAEYIPNAHGGWELSLRGRLLGHKLTVVEWIVESVTKYSIELPTDHYEAILHVLTAVPNAPDWMGLRKPLLVESGLLSIADRISGTQDLMNKSLPKEGGFGIYHRHLNMAPFKVRG